jgi:hypothetical protein
LDDDWCKSNACLELSDQHKCDPKSPDADPATGCVFKLWKEEGTECKIENACVEKATCVKDPTDPKKMVCKGQEEKECPDDGNPCTDDECEDQEGKAVCMHEADDTNPCDDGNKCTAGELCVSGKCVPGTLLTCPDDDGNPCNGPKCVPTTGECINEPLEDGDTCQWSGACAAKACKGGMCVAVPLVSDGTVDLCDGLDNDCDGKVDENCYMEYTLVGGAWTSGNAMSGDGTLRSVLGYPPASPGTADSATDGKYTVYPIPGEQAK